MVPLPGQLGQTNANLLIILPVFGGLVPPAYRIRNPQIIVLQRPGEEWAIKSINISLYSKVGLKIWNNFLFRNNEDIYSFTWNAIFGATEDYIHLLTSLWAATFCLSNSNLSTFSLDITSCNLENWPATIFWDKWFQSYTILHFFRNFLVYLKHISPFWLSVWLALMSLVFITSCASRWREPWTLCPLAARSSKFKRLH